MGSSAIYQMAKRNISVLGIDRFSPPHTLGSTHGETRITRQAIGEGAHYTPLAVRSYEIFREVEQRAQTKFLEVTGGLIISSDSKGLLLTRSPIFSTTPSPRPKGTEFGMRFSKRRISEENFRNSTWMTTRSVTTSMERHFCDPRLPYDLSLTWLKPLEQQCIWGRPSNLLRKRMVA